LPVEVWTRFMRIAHQGVPVAALPNAQVAPPALAQIASQITAPTPRETQAVPQPASGGRGRHQLEPRHAPSRPRGWMAGWWTGCSGARFRAR